MTARTFRVSAFEHKFEYDTDDNTYYVSATWTEEVDKDYGADADGRRGRAAYFIMDVKFSIARDGRDLTSAIQKSKPKLYAAINKQVTEMAHNGKGTNLTKKYARD